MITLNQEPTQYNVVVSPNVYTLGGITANIDAYVLQVEGYNETLDQFVTLATIQQPANPAGVGQFDVSKILQSQMEIGWVEDIGQQVSAVPTPGVSLTYKVSYGSVTNNLISFDGVSANKMVINGYDNWRYKDWPTQSTFIPSPATQTCEFVAGFGFDAIPSDTKKFLSNYPGTIPVRSDVNHTLSFFNRLGNYQDGTSWGNMEQPFALRIKYYDVDNNLITTYIKSINAANGLGPRVAFDSNQPLSYLDSQLIGTIPAGPKNLKAAQLWPPTVSAIWNQVTQTWGNENQLWNTAQQMAMIDHYTIEVCAVDMCYWNANGAPQFDSYSGLLPYLGYVMYSQEFKVADACTGYDPITVSFLNQYGVKDYYTFDRRNTLNQSVKRNDYDQVLGSWSASTFNIDPHGRGRRTFSTEIQTKMTMASYWMEDDESKWLEELFTSPHIQVNYDGVWHPAVITSRGYTQKTNSRDGLFQHTLEVEFANTKKVQRG